MRTRAWAYEFRPTSWSDLRARYTELSEIDQRFRYLLDVVDSVEDAGLGDSMAASTSMHDLVVADLPLTDVPLEVIVVRAPSSPDPPKPGQVLIEHLSHTGRNDRIERPAADAVPLFWRFVQEKWGLTAPGTRS